MDKLKWVLLGFLILLGGCSSEKVVEPGPLPTIDSRAVEAARSSLAGLKVSASGFYQRTYIQLDSINLNTVGYTRAFLDSLNLAGFMECLTADTIPSCPYMYTDTIMRINQPGDTDFLYYIIPDDGLIENGVTQFKVKVFYDSLHRTPYGNNPRPFMEFDSLFQANIIYAGYLNGPLAGSNFSCNRIDYTLYPAGTAYDYVVTALKAARADMYLQELVRPDSGSMTHLYSYKSDSAKALAGLAGSTSYLTTRSDSSYFSKRSDGFFGTNFYKEVRKYADGAVLTRYCNAAVQATLEGSDTVVVVRKEDADTSFTIRLPRLNAKRIIARPAGTAPAGDAVLLSGAGDTLIKVVSASAGTRFTGLTYDSGHAVDSIPYTVSGPSLLWTDSTSLSVTRDTLSLRNNALYLTFARREAGSGSVTFSGEFTVDLFTRRGEGFVYDAAARLKYRVTLSLDNVSKLEDVEL